MPDLENVAADPFGAVRAEQIKSLGTSIDALTREFAAFKQSVVTRTELYLTIIITILVVIIIGLIVIMFVRGV